MKIFPTKKQFENWKLPSQITYRSFWLAILAIFLAIIFFCIQFLTGATKKGQEITHKKLDTIDRKLSEAIPPNKSKKSLPKQYLNDKEVDEITKLVTTLETILSEDKAEIKSPDYIEDKITGELRKVDISINKIVGSVPVLIIIECKNKSIENDTLWIEQIAQKRDAIKAAKAVAVFNDYLSDSASEKASHLNIATRLISKITPDDISDWFQVKYLNQWNYHVDFLSVSFRTDEENQEQLHEFIKSDVFKKKFNTEEELFLNTSDNKKYSFNHIWRGMLSKKRSEIYQGVKPSGEKLRRTLFASFSNPKSRYQLITDKGNIDILEIKEICDLWIEEKHIPFTLSQYSSQDDQLVDSAGVKIEADGIEYNINLHKDIKTGNMYISGNNLSDVKFDFKEVKKDEISE